MNPTYVQRTPNCSARHRDDNWRRQEAMQFAYVFVAPKVTPNSHLPLPCCTYEYTGIHSVSFVAHRGICQGIEGQKR